jgi:hypothetical protein
MVQPVQWDENQQPGIIVQLNARDYDSEQNGPPFNFRIADTASEDIVTKFAITGKLYCKCCLQWLTLEDSVDFRDAVEPSFSVPQI